MDNCRRPEMTGADSQGDNRSTGLFIPKCDLSKECMAQEAVRRDLPISTKNEQYWAYAGPLARCGSIIDGNALSGGGLGEGLWQVRERV